MAGTTGQIRQIPRETLMNFKMHMGVEDTLIRLIGYEAYESSKVGGRIDIIRLTADGAEWIKKKDECRERDPVE